LCSGVEQRAGKILRCVELATRALDRYLPHHDGAEQYLIGVVGEMAGDLIPDPRVVSQPPTTARRESIPEPTSEAGVPEKDVMCRLA
jgi:hypothetical protein